MRTLVRLVAPFALALLVLAPSVAAAHPKARQLDAPKTAPAAQGLLFVEWHGSWWAAQELRSDKGRTLVHYLGWSSSWDEEVEPARMRHADPQGHLHVEWGGSYWRATMLSTERDGFVRVHYDGWGQEWDET